MKCSSRLTRAVLSCWVFLVYYISALKTAVAVKVFIPPNSKTKGCTVSFPYASYHSYSSKFFPNCDKEYYAKQYYIALKDKMLNDFRINTAFHILAYDDHSEPIVPDLLLENQISFLNSVFGKHGITFNVKKVYVNNTHFRKRLNVPFCNREDIGNGICSLMCNISTTNYDGGDCVDVDKFGCNRTSIGNNICNQNCNFKIFKYDGGDCCLEQEKPVENCVDPSNKGLRWYSYAEYKDMAFKQSGIEVFNVGFTSMPDCKWCGGMTTAPFVPWGAWKNRQTSGSILRDITIGGPQNSDIVKGGGAILLHEVGHALGLGHTFIGVEAGSFNMGGGPFCKGDGPMKNHQCLERNQNSRTWSLGDLCPDTLPSPVAFGCRGDKIKDTALTPAKDCDGNRWVNFTKNNFMGFNYLQAGCKVEFTMCQYSKMRCTLDDVYSSWQSLPQSLIQPSTVVLEPIAELTNASSVQLLFAAPLNVGLRDGNKSGSNLLSFQIERKSILEEKVIVMNTKEQNVFQGQLVVYVDKTVLPGTTYVYRVRAVNPKNGRAGHSFSYSSRLIHIPRALPSPSPASSDRNKTKNPQSDAGILIVIIVAAVMIILPIFVFVIHGNWNSLSVLSHSCYNCKRRYFTREYERGTSFDLTTESGGKEYTIL